ncbi:exopolysaccharide production protein ExoQ [Amorphus suaedae]
MRTRPATGPSPFLKPPPAGRASSQTRMISAGSGPAPSPRMRASQRLDVLMTWVATLLLVALLVYELVGIYPFVRLEAGSAGVADGDARRRLILLAMFAAGLLLCAARPKEALRLAKTCWPILLVVGLMSVSVLWSRFPHLTIRRSVVYWIYLVIILGVTVWVRPASRLLAVCAVTAALALVADLVATAVVPGQSWTPIGLAALHLHKNMAGSFAFIALAFIGPQFFVARSTLTRLAIAGLVAAGIVFLLLTQSKNSIGGFAITWFAILPTLVLLRSGRGPAALIMALLAAGLALAFVLSGALDWSLDTWIEAGSGDASFTGRTDLWRAAVDYINQSPFLGDGFGAHWSVPDAAHPLLNKAGWWSGNYWLMLRYNQSHNGYLDIAIQLGMLGIALVLVYLVALFAALRRIFRLTPGDLGRIAPVYGVACLIIGILLLNTLESSLFFPASAPGTILLLLSVLVFDWSATLTRARQRPPSMASATRSPFLR